MLDNGKEVITTDSTLMCYMSGGEIFLPSIYGKDDPKGELIRAALERLLPDSMDEVKGWDVNSLNLQMIVMLRKDCAATDKKIKTDPFADLMSPEDAERYLRFLKNGGTAGLTPEELAGIQKVDDYLLTNSSAYSKVIYSGKGNRDLAEAFADMNKIVTLEKTTGGKFLDDADLFNPETSPLTQNQAREVWSIVSERYAQQASGNAYGFVNGADPNSIFNTYEYPALQNNSNITNVFTELIGGL